MKRNDSNNDFLASLADFSRKRDESERLLEHLRQNAEHDGNDEVARLAFAPLSEEFRNSAVDSILQRQRFDRRKSSRRVLLMAASVLTAVGLATLLYRTEPEPWPEFDVQISGTRQESRSAPAHIHPQGHQRLLFDEGNSFELVLNAAFSVPSPATATLLRWREGAWEPWPAEFELSEHGNLQVRAVAGSDLLPIGESLLFIAVAPAGSSPQAGGEVGVHLTVIVDGSGPVAEPAASDFEFAGCADIRRDFTNLLRGPVCQLAEPRRLQLWVRRGIDDRIDVTPPAVAEAEVQDGTLFELELPADSQLVEVRVDGRDRRARRWSLAVEPVPEYPRLRHFYELSKATDLESAVAWHEAGSPSDGERGKALMQAVALHYSRDEDQELDAALDEAIAAFHRAGLLGSAASQEGFRLQRCLRERNFERCPSLARTFSAVRGHTESQWRQLYYRGLLAKNTGNVRGALRFAQTASEVAERTGLKRLHDMATFLAAQSANLLGRYDTAFESLKELDQAETFGPCEQARVKNEIAWSALMRREDPRRAKLLADRNESVEVRDDRRQCKDVQACFEEALALLKHETCTAEWQVAVRVRLGQVLGYLMDGQIAKARLELQEIRQIHRSPGTDTALWSQELDARLHLAEGNAPAALDIYEELGRFAELTSWPEGEWRAAVGRASALVALGDTDAADRAFQDAEFLLDRELLRLPIDQRLGTLVIDRQRSVEQHLQILFDEGRLEDALGVLRRAHSRAVRSLRRFGDLPVPQQRRWIAFSSRYLASRRTVDEIVTESWRIPVNRRYRPDLETERRLLRLRQELDQRLAELETSHAEKLPELAPGEALLTCHPLPTDWLCLLADGKGVAVQRVTFEDLPSERAALHAMLAERLLKPWAERIQHAGRLRWRPPGGLDHVDLHALPFGDSVLLDTIEVAYALDLRSSERTPRSQDRALIVADAGGDLDDARAEAATVESSIEGGGRFSSVLVLSQREAVGSAVREALGNSQLFHFASHAKFAGWGSSLQLAAGTKLQIDDVLALSRAPEQVVLAACNAGRGRKDDFASNGTKDDLTASLGIAQAFVVAGSQAVVAPVRPIDDAQTHRLITLLYRYWEPELSLGEALRLAQLKMRSEDPRSSWAAFRLFEP